MIPIFSQENISFQKFLFDFALKNEACILDKSFTNDWKAVKEWRKTDGKPNLENLLLLFGNFNLFNLSSLANNVVPVIEDCTVYKEMKFSDFVNNFVKTNQCKHGYIKDWHFQSQFIDSYLYYTLPTFLKMDWINNENWTSNIQNPFQGDYRFVYFGFHCDVLETFSWSANICGRKLWYILRPGMEEHFKLGRDTFMEDIRLKKNIWNKAGLIEIIQEEGQIFFIPTGWWHQENTISINHNVLNVCNIELLVKFIETRKIAIKKEIQDVEHLFSKNEFIEKCEVKFPYTFFKFLEYLIGGLPNRFYKNGRLNASYY